jgi:hypothetical protein
MWAPRRNANEERERRNIYKAIPKLRSTQKTWRSWAREKFAPGEKAALATGILTGAAGVAKMALVLNPALKTDLLNIISVDMGTTALDGTVTVAKRLMTGSEATSTAMSVMLKAWKGTSPHILIGGYLASFAAGAALATWMGSNAGQKLEKKTVELRSTMDTLAQGYYDITADPMAGLTRRRLAFRVYSEEALKAFRRATEGYDDIQKRIIQSGIPDCDLSSVAAFKRYARRLADNPPGRPHKQRAHLPQYISAVHYINAYGVPRRAPALVLQNTHNARRLAANFPLFTERDAFARQHRGESIKSMASVDRDYLKHYYSTRKRPGVGEHRERGKFERLARIFRAPRSSVAR